MDKEKSCEGCPDRSVEPNCHMTCEGYLERQAELKRINKKRRSDRDAANDFINFRLDAISHIARDRHKRKGKEK